MTILSFFFVIWKRQAGSVIMDEARLNITTSLLFFYDSLTSTSLYKVQDSLNVFDI